MGKTVDGGGRSKNGGTQEGGGRAETDGSRGWLSIYSTIGSALRGPWGAQSCPMPCGHTRSVRKYQRSILRWGASPMGLAPYSGCLPVAAGVVIGKAAKCASRSGDGRKTAPIRMGRALICSASHHRSAVGASRQLAGLGRRNAASDRLSRLEEGVACCISRLARDRGEIEVQRCRRHPEPAKRWTHAGLAAGNPGQVIGPACDRSVIGC